MMYRRNVLAGLAATSGAGMLRSARAKEKTTGQVLFQQPDIGNDIANHFSVTAQPRPWNPIGIWFAHANQSNPFRSDNSFVPVNWDPEHLTGLQVSGDRHLCQRGIFNTQANLAAGHTVAQMQGNAVGAYLNSVDLVRGSPGNRMMISPQFLFPDPMYTPFAKKHSVVTMSVDLQVPHATAAGINGVSNAYAKIDLLFYCIVKGVAVCRFDYSCGLFTLDVNPKRDVAQIDTLTNTVIASHPLSSYTSGVNILPGSSQLQSSPWRGWKTFAWTIEESQFAAGIEMVARAFPTFALSKSTADYQLASTHLNAEIHYASAYPTTLGWSMRNLTISVSD